MIIFIHGDDLVSSRNFLLNVKSEKNIDTFYADSDDPNTLLQLLQGDGLFNQSKSLIIENLFSKKASQSYKLIESKLKTIKELDLYIWESRELSKSQLSALGRSENKLFKIPQKVFYFLDNISPGNERNIKLFHDALDGTEEEFVFFMLIRQFRLMLNIMDQKSEIDEVRRLAPWQKNKLISQSKKFDIKNLIEAYKRLYEIESRMKVGNLNMPLVAAIDIFLIEI